MKKWITFRELLNLIYEGRQPNKVWLIGTNIEWEWHKYCYININDVYTEDAPLEVVVSDFYTAKQLAEEKIIIFFDEILDDKEKEYLSNVIKPFKKCISAIKKIPFYNEQEKIIILDKNELSFIVFPNFKEGTMYKGMELYKGYTLEELGL